MKRKMSYAMGILFISAFLLPACGGGETPITELCFAGAEGQEIAFNTICIGEVGERLERGSDEDFRVCFGTEHGDLMAAGWYTCSHTPAVDTHETVDNEVYVRLDEVTPDYPVTFPEKGGGSVVVDLQPILDELEALKEALANTNKAMIRILVLTADSNGEMAEGVSVKVNPNTAEEQAFVTEAGVELEVDVDAGATPKNYEVRAEKEGYGLKTAMANVGAGDVAEVRFFLQKVEEPEEGLVDRPDFAKALADGEINMCTLLDFLDPDGVRKDIPCDHLTLEVTAGDSVAVDLPDNPTKLLFLDTGVSTIEFCYEGSGYDCKSFNLTIY